MRELHLNIEAASVIQDRMVKDQAHIEELLASLAEAVHGLEEGAWVSNSASQFFNNYEELDAACRRQMEVMRILADRFKQEIEEWGNAGEKF